MKKILVTGGTVFVSRNTAEWFLLKGYEVYVLNRGSKPQIEGVRHILADRNNLSNAIRDFCFDAVIDVCAYNQTDIENLLNGLGQFKDYIFVSSSAVYPEYNVQPFKETQPVGANKFWGSYGLGKIAAEKYLLSRVPDAYILRPPYIYGDWQNIYREPFVFDCALNGRKFYIPKDGSMKMQFIHVLDICRFIEIILQERPANHIFNVGNNEVVDVNRYVELCYEAAGANLEKIFVQNHENQRGYFPFDDYGYELDVAQQNILMPDRIPFERGLKSEYEWYKNNKNAVRKKGYMEYIDKYLGGSI